MILGMPIDLLFDYAAIRLDGPAAVAHPITVNLDIGDLDGDHCFQIRRGVLHYWPKRLPEPDATLTLPHAMLHLPGTGLHSVVTVVSVAGLTGMFGYLSTTTAGTSNSSAVRNLYQTLGSP
ncbi:hypothetical protein NONO_c51570 [Nocardia nova SH22a]|uniref:Alkyl sulfatase C-terminal domain-containing protein n=1 Tax=Nocardia nova SH22a TaxID=1415166 RepID=W5TRU4_9NOCA|nr:alkyl sulfatase C-terminal domain-containing protein [Nocardia nova]AHH19941.1 hypothetical protein NONO_c51570 [Nocardia nova SH22a]